MPSYRAEFFVQVVPVYSPWQKDKIVGAKVAKMTQSKPDKPVGGCQVVKLVLDVDEDLFVPKTPNIAITLNKSHINYPQVAEQEIMWDPNES